jgi:hypothetical protein
MENEMRTPVCCRWDTPRRWGEKKGAASGLLNYDDSRFRIATVAVGREVAKTASLGPWRKEDVRMLETLEQVRVEEPLKKKHERPVSGLII